jgi:hypothetical protein
VAVTRRSAPLNDSPRRSSAALAPAQTLRGFAQGCARRAVGLRGRGFEFGQLSSEIALLLRRQPIELLAELLQVLARLLRIAVAVRLGLACRGARQGAAQGRQ